jgi:hypothetical protein
MSYLDIDRTKSYLKKAGCLVKGIKVVNGDLSTLEGRFMEPHPWSKKGYVLRDFIIRLYDNGMAVTTDDFRGHKLHFYEGY